MLMQNRLSKRERDAILNHYKNDILFKWMNRSGRGLEREMTRFRFSVEELFLEVMRIVDQAKESPRDAREEYADLWNTLFCKYRDIDIADSKETEIEMAVSEVIYVSQHLLGMLESSRYASLCLELTGQISLNSAQGYEKMMQIFVPEMYKLKEETLRARIEAYMQNYDEWISDNICDMLKELPEERKNVDEGQDESSVSSGEQLTNRQLIILFMHILNLGNNSRDVNVKAFAELIAKVSGRSSGSIRQKLMEDIDYESSKVHADIDRLAVLLRPLSPKCADLLNNSKE